MVLVFRFSHQIEISVSQDLTAALYITSSVNALTKKGRVMKTNAEPFLFSFLKFWNKNRSTGKKMSYRLHKLKHLSLLDLLHFEDVLQGDLIEVLPHVIHLIVRLQQEKLLWEMSSLVWETETGRGLTWDHTSCRCASFFLAERLRCFSRTPQYFSVSLSYFFLASCQIKAKLIAECCLARILQQC